MLIDIAGGEPRPWILVDSLGDISPDQEAQRGFTSPRSEESAVFVDQYSYDREARRYAVLALGNLAISFASHEDLMVDRSLKALNEVSHRFLVLCDKSLHIQQSHPLTCNNPSKSVFCF